MDVRVSKGVRVHKNCLASDPILKPIDLNPNLVISCNASIYGIGLVIMQTDDDGMLHAVRYGSCATTPARLITQQGF